MPHDIRDVSAADPLFVSVIGGGGGGGSSVDREIVITTYTVKTAFTGASVGDIITEERVMDVSGATATQVGATIWHNETTSADLASAPSFANLTIAGTGSLTDTQLRATPVPVSGTVAVTGVATQTTLAALLAALGTPYQGGGALPLPSGAATQTTLAAVLTALGATLAVAPVAGENHIGKVGGETLVATATPTVTASSAYATGNVIGGKLTFSGFGRVTGGTGTIHMAAIDSKAAQTSTTLPCDLVLFHTDPTNTTFTDKSALALNAADFDKIIDVVHITDWTNLGTPSFAKANNLGIPYKVATGASDIYGVLVARGTPTFGSTSDLKVILKGFLD